MTTKNTSDTKQSTINRGLTRRTALGVGGALAASTMLGPSLTSARQATPLAGTELSARIDAVVVQIMEQSGVPGVAIGLVQNDEVVHLAGYGVREVGKPDLIDADTVFQLASVSKGMASATVAAIIGDGFTSWDAVATELYPAFALSDAWITGHTTLRDLFCHREGLPSHAGDLHEDLGFSLEEIVHQLRFFDAYGAFRAHYEYTNFGLSVAAYAAAAAAGEDWNDIAQRRVYEPLGMTSTSSRFSDYIARSNRAIPHQRIEPGVFQFVEQRQPDAQTPAGGVSSTARDMTQYLRMLLGNGMLDGEQVIDSMALGETFLPHIAPNRVDNPAIDRTSFYGLGWNVSYGSEGQMQFSHSGAFSLGAGTYISMVPSAGFGLIVLTNGSPTGAAESVGLSVTDLVFRGEVAFDYVPILEEVIAAATGYPHDRGIDFSVQPEGFTESLPLAVYAGDYWSDLWTLATVTDEGGSLVLHLGPNATPYPMNHYSDNRFLFQPPGENGGPLSIVSFAVGPDGLADRLTIDYLNETGQGTLLRVVEAES